MIALEPLLDWMLLRLDPIEKQEGSIVLLHGQVTRTGTVLRTGPGRLLRSGIHAPMDVAPGDRVVFRREHLEHKMGKQLVGLLQELGDDLGLIREPDVLYAFEEDATKPPNKELR